MTTWVLDGRYLVFGGDQYYPMGGWDDKRGAFSDLDEARKEAAKWEWWQIIDTGQGHRTVDHS